MPRRRNCASSMFEIWRANSSLSGMCDRHSMFFPGACVQDLFDLREREVALFLSIVKMRRNAYAGLGPVVDEDLSGNDFAPSISRVVIRIDFSRIAPIPTLLRISSPGRHA